MARKRRQTSRPKKRRRLTTSQIFDDGTLLDQAMQDAFRDACIHHKQGGVPLVVWRDGKIVEIPPEEIEIPPPVSGENRGTGKRK